MFNIEEIIYILPLIFISLPFHEYAHAYISYRLGDPTAKNQGRLTINPFKHLDLVGTIMMLSPLHVGWAKPVPINPMYYKNKKQGTILVSFAGPLANLFLAFIFSFPYALLESINSGNQIPSVLLQILQVIFYFLVVIDVRLAVFNLLPIPPLDGSKILSGLLPTEIYFKLMKYERYIGIAFLIIIFTTNILGTVISYVADPIMDSMLYLARLLF